MRDRWNQETAGGISIRLKRRTNLGSLSHRGIERGVNESGGTKTEAGPRKAASTLGVLIADQKTNFPCNSITLGDASAPRPAP